MNKRVHQIAKEHGLAAKEVLERLKAAGLQVKAVSSSVDEAEARRILGDGAAQASAPAADKPAPRDGDGARAPSGNGPPARARSDAPARGRTERSDAPPGASRCAGPRSH